MDEHRFILEPYKGLISRYQCPTCKKAKTFSRYIDTESGQHIHSDVGRCSRESNCGYHRTPKQYFQDNPIAAEILPPKILDKPLTIQIPKPASFIPVPIFKQSLKEFYGNHFVKFLIGLFGTEITRKLISQYYIGTSKHWPGATVFWQIDCAGHIRTGKVMLYNPTTGKRVKEPYNHITWAHKEVELPEFQLRQCMYGEHLLRTDLLKPIAIVESEKTAIISSVYLPQFIWLAVGSLTNLNPDICQALKGRRVALFPDLKGFEKWTKKADELSTLANFSVSDLLERKANEIERIQGLDLADFLIRFDYREFSSAQPKKIALELTPVITAEFHRLNLFPSKPKTELLRAKVKNIDLWDLDLAELESFFNETCYPVQSIKMNPYTIIDVTLFIQSHLAVAKYNKGNRTYLPYLDRLKDLRQYLMVNNQN